MMTPTAVGLLPCPDDLKDLIVNLVQQHFNEQAQRVLLFSRSKDGIDVDYPTFAIEQFATHLLKARAALSALAAPADDKKQFAEWREQLLQFNRALMSAKTFEQTESVLTYHVHQIMRALAAPAVSAEVEQVCAEIEARCNAATEGPWEAHPNEAGGFEVTARGSQFVGNFAILCQRSDWPRLSGECRANGLFMAAARTDIPRLLALVRRLDAELQQWRTLQTDPAAVRVNLLRGTLAKPDDLIFMHDSDGPYARLDAERRENHEEAERWRPKAQAYMEICQRFGLEGQVIKHIERLTAQLAERRAVQVAAEREVERLREELAQIRHFAIGCASSSIHRASDFRAIANTAEQAIRSRAGGDGRK